MIATILLISQKWQKLYGNKTFYIEKECLTNFFLKKKKWTQKNPKKENTNVLANICK